MTKDEFIQKWINYSTDTYEAMEFDLVSVIAWADNEELKKHLEKYEDQLLPKEEGEIMPEDDLKAYGITQDESKKYIKSVNFGHLRGA